MLEAGKRDKQVRVVSVRGQPERPASPVEHWSHSLNRAKQP